MKSQIRSAIVAMALGVIPVVSWSQVGSGSMAGTVKDATGALVVGADVAIVDKQVGTTQHLTTNSDGRYVVPDMVVGVYDVQANATGFKTQKHVDVQVSVGRQVVVDFSLVLGEESQTVTVQGVESQVETSTSDQSAQIGQQQMRQLPLNGRNFEQLILLAPGVQQVTSGTSNSFYGRSNSYSIAGSRPEGQELILDGANIQGFWGHGAGNSIIGTSLGVEAIGEFQVLTNTYSARFGGSGSVMNATTRSGTNQFHGSAFEFLRNSAFDSRNYFNTSAMKDSFRRNQFGGTLGGPAKKDKLFFFVNYEGIRQELGESSVTDIPDTNARQGLLPCSSAPGVMCSPETNLANVGVNPAVAAALALFPAPSASARPLGGGVVSDVAQGQEPAEEDYVNARLDYTIGPKDSAFIRYVYDNGSLTDPFSTGLNALNIFPEVSQGRNQYLTLGERKIVSSALVNDARFSFVRTKMNAFTTSNYSAINFFPGENRQDGEVSIPGLTALGPSSFTPDSEIQNTYSVGDDVFWTHGNNTLETGIEFGRQQSNVQNGFFSGGTWTFPSLTAFLQNQPSTFVGALPNSANSYRGFREWRLFPYVQDTWKILPILTLNAGVRWNFISNPTEAHNLLCAFVDPSDPTQTGCQHVNNVFPSNPSLTSIDPRIGLALDPFSDHKTSFRAGFGLFHDSLESRTYLASYQFTSPYITSAQPCGAGLPACTFPTPFTGFYVPIPTISEALAYQSHTTPFMMQYNFDIQRQIAKDTVLSIAYIGSLGRNLVVENDLNPPIPDSVNGKPNFAGAPAGPGLPETIGSSTARKNPNLGALAYGVPNGPSNYSALQLYLTRNISKNLQFQATYSYSKCMDNGSSTYSLESTNSAQTQYNPYDQSMDYGLCNFDVRHSFVGNAVYQFPFKGNRFAEGWQYGIITFAHSGNPFTVFDGFDRADLNDPAGLGGNQRPDLTPGRSNNAILGKVGQWFDPSAFQLQAPGSLGDLGRNTLIGPKYADLDMEVAKTTRLSDQITVQLRAEAFNILNHPNFALPNTTLYTGPTCAGYPTIAGLNLNCPGSGISSPNSGQITSTVSTSRQLQFAMKIMF